MNMFEDPSSLATWIMESDEVVKKIISYANYRVSCGEPYESAMDNAFLDAGITMSDLTPNDREVIFQWFEEQE